MRNLLAKVIYGFTFTVLIPLGLIAWSQAVSVPFVVIKLPRWGLGVALMGLLILLSGMITLVIRGEGLPMNASPPRKLVTKGIYAWIPHPVYVGFTVLCLGVSLQCGSAAGLWLTTPLVALSCLALAIGYENPCLLRRHGATPNPWIGCRLAKPISHVLMVDKTWEWMLKWTEEIANSWSERRIGPIRIVNHGIYGGIAGGVGAFGVVWLSGATYAGDAAVIFLAGIAGAALWAQLLEGSSALLRPFGYYGGVVGILLGGLILAFLGRDVLVVLAAWGCVGSFVQAVGRVRCLIQGCCHGRVSAGTMGIRVRNEHSRVCALAHLKDTAIYPTQLYSIIGNIVAGLVLASLWLLAAPLTVIIGGYFILAGIVRFIEEGYRGEPQTKIIMGLPVYQWLSVLSVAAGMLAMLKPSAAAPAPQAGSVVVAVISGVGFFFMCWFAYGVDFPSSKMRFSRLSG
jgi:protein-S-isoprenylcysteine O-methyltransferase Ste14